MVLRVLGALVVATATVVVGSAAPQNADPYLRGVIGMSAGQIKRVRSGEAVAMSLEGREGREIVTFGAIRITTAPEAVLTFLGGAEALRQGPAVKQLGLLNAPPQPDDLSAFTLHPKSAASLPTCRIGECAVQLPGWAVTKFTNDVPWSAGDSTSAVHAVARSVALETLGAYRRGGHRALSPYDDRRPPTHPSTEYTRLLGEAEYMPAPLTAVRQALNGFPHLPSRGIRDQFFWTVVDFGMKPTFRLNHMAIASGPALDEGSAPLAGAVATIQLLATHYFSSTLEWHFVARDRDNSAVTYLYYLSRSSAPGLTGIRGRVARHTIRSRAEDGIEQYLALTKRRLDAGR